MRTRGITLALGVLAAAACGPSATTRPHMVDRRHMTMGSSLHVSAWTADDVKAGAAFEKVFQEFDRLDGLLSVWKPASDVVRINEAAGDHPVTVGPETLEVLRAARQISEWTGGKFDVTFGAFSDIWKFDHDQDNQVPSPDQIKSRLPLIDYRKILIDEEKHTVMLERHGMRLHLGGIGKGYAVDRGVQILRAAGFNDFMIQAGGDFYASGMHENQPWRVGIRDPRGPADRPFAALSLSDATFSTSGDYERFFMKDGRRYHHIIDPATGEPAPLCRSVTLVTNLATVADALAKGVFILGPEKGLALVERLPDVEAVIVSSKNEVLVSSGLKDKLLTLATPTDAP